MHVFAFEMIGMATYTINYSKSAVFVYSKICNGILQCNQRIIFHQCVCVCVFDIVNIFLLCYVCMSVHMVSVYFTIVLISNFP